MEEGKRTSSSYYVSIEDTVSRCERKEEDTDGKDYHPLGHSILAKTDTWLTRFPADQYLQAEEKLFVPKGSAWEWSKIVVTAAFV